MFPKVWRLALSKRARDAMAAAFALGALCGAGQAPCRAEEKPKTKLLYLVARPSIVDPYFEHSVVLMVPLEERELVVGLIVNKPAPPQLLELFPDSPELKARPDMVYFGGPVDMDSLALAFHAAKPPKQAVPLYDDVYLSFDSDFIAQWLKDPKQGGEARLFLGRSQWAPEQLQGEALRGSWFSLRAEGQLIFEHDYQHLWNRIHQRANPPLSTRNQWPAINEAHTTGRNGNRSLASAAHATRRNGNRRSAISEIAKFRNFGKSVPFCPTAVASRNVRPIQDSRRTP